jgi:hypothetical protein
LVGFALANRAPRRSIGGIGLMVLIASIGEGVVLTLGGTLLANELVPAVAWIYWLIGTGVVIQPVAAVVGARIGRIPAPSASV